VSDLLYLKINVDSLGYYQTEPWKTDLKDTEMKFDKMMAEHVLLYGSEFWRVREINKKELKPMKCIFLSQ
jgi:hypothetical protein